MKILHVIGEERNIMNNCRSSNYGVRNLEIVGKAEIFNQFDGFFRNLLIELNDIKIPDFLFHLGKFCFIAHALKQLHYSHCRKGDVGVADNIEFLKCIRSSVKSVNQYVCIT